MTNRELIAALVAAGFGKSPAGKKFRLTDPRHRVADILLPEDDRAVPTGMERLLANWCPTEVPETQGDGGDLA